MLRKQASDSSSCKSSEYSSFDNATTFIIPQGKMLSSSGSSASGAGHPTNSINSDGSKSFFLGDLSGSPNKSPMISEGIKSSSNGSSGYHQLQAGQKNGNSSPIKIHKTSAQNIAQKSAIMVQNQKYYPKILEQNKSEGSPLKKLSDDKPPTSNYDVPLNQQLQTSEAQQLKKKIERIQEQLEEERRQKKEQLQRIQEQLEKDRKEKQEQLQRMQEKLEESRREKQEQLQKMQEKLEEERREKQEQRQRMQEQLKEEKMGKKEQSQRMQRMQQLLLAMHSAKSFSGSSQGSESLKKSKIPGSSKKEQSSNESLSMDGSFMQESEKNDSLRHSSSFGFSEKQNPQALFLKQKQKYYDHSNQRQQESELKKQKYTQSVVLLKNSKQEKPKQDPQKYLLISVQKKVRQNKQPTIENSFLTHLTNQNQDLPFKGYTQSDKKVNAQTKKLIEKVQKQIVTSTSSTLSDKHQIKREKGTSDRNGKGNGCCGI